MATAKDVALFVFLVSLLAGLVALGVRSGLPSRDEKAQGPLSEESSIQDLDDHIRVFAHPFSRFGLYVGVRGSAIKISKEHGGGCVVYNPVNLTATTKKSLDQWCGSEKVRFIVAPSDVHHIYLDQLAEAYPQAELVAAKNMPSKHKKHASKFKYILDDPNNLPNVPWGNDLKLVFLPDYTHQEVLLMHTTTSTLLVADMVWNMPAIDAYSKVKVSDAERNAPLQRLVDGAVPASNIHRGLVRMASGLTGPSDRTKASMMPVFTQWQPKRIIVQHGEVITRNGTAMLKDAWSWTGFPSQANAEKGKDEL